MSDSKAIASAEEPSNAEILRAVQKVSEKVDKIETAPYGTGNPHGGLFGKFEALTAKVDGVESKLEGKIDDMDKNFDRMFNFARWVIGGLVGTICVAIILPIIQKWIGN